MRRALVLLGLVLTCSYQSVAQKETDRERSGFVGPVRNVRVETAKVSNVSGQMVESERVLVYVSSFDEKGNATESIVYNPDGSLNRKHGWGYTYDDKGRVTERTFLNANGVLTAKAFFNYDDRGRQVEATFFSPPGSVNHVQSYAYDDKGNMIREVHRNPDGTIRNSQVNTYDADGRLTEYSLHKPDGTFYQRNVYTYDGRGRETGWAIYKEDGAPVMGLTRRYDEKGNVSELLRHSKGVITARETYAYEFDSRGNWVKRKTERETTRDGKTKVELEVAYRTITYF